MKHWCRWLLFEQHLFVPKHVTLSEKMRLAWNQHSIVFIDSKWGTLIRPRSRYVIWYVGEMPTSSSENSQLVQTDCLKSSRQDNKREAVRCMLERLLGKQIESCTLRILQARSEERLKHPDRWLLFEQLYVLQSTWPCRRRWHRTKWPSPIFLNLSRASCMCGCVDINWVTVMRAGGRHVNSNLFQWEVPACLTKFLCWDIPKLEVSTPCRKRKRTREDAILKRQGTCFNPHFPRQSVNCYGRDNRGCCEYRLPEKNPWIFHIETE